MVRYYNNNNLMKKGQKQKSIIDSTTTNNINNININLCYNLKADNSKIFKQNCSEQNKSESIKCKKIANKNLNLDVPITLKKIQIPSQNLLRINEPKYSFNPNQQPQFQSLENECQLSLNLIKKNKCKVGGTSSKVVKKNKSSYLKNIKTQFSLKNKKKFNQSISGITPSNKNQKKFFQQLIDARPSIQFSQFSKVYRQKKKQGSRQKSQSKKSYGKNSFYHDSVIKKTQYRQSLNKKQGKGKINISVQDKIKTESSIGLGFSTNKKTKKVQNEKKSFIKSTSTEKYLLKKKQSDIQKKPKQNKQQNMEMFKFINKIIQNSEVSYSQFFKSEFPSKNLSDARNNSQKEILLNNTIQINSNISEIRNLQGKYNNLFELNYEIVDSKKLNSIIKIQRWWRQIKKPRFYQYYSNIFLRNMNTYNIFKDIKNEKYIQDIPQFKQQNNSEISNIHINLDEGIQKQYDHTLTSKQQQQAESQFDINKYQQFVQKQLHQQQSVGSLKNQIKFKRSQDIQKLKQHQAQQWNHINKLINKQLNNQNQIDQKQFLQQLMKQSQLNKKWLQQNFQDNQQTPEQYNINSIKASLNSKKTKTQKYKNLIEENGIIQKIRNINIKIYKTYDFSNLKKISIKRCSSTSHLATQPFSFNNTSNQLIVRKSKENQELFENYLDCGLGYCGIQNMNEMNNLKKMDETIEQNIRKSQELRKKIKNAVDNYDESKLMQVPQCQKQQYLLDEKDERGQLQINNEWNRLNLEILIKNLNEYQNINISQNQITEDDDKKISIMFQQEKYSKNTIFQSIYHQIIQQFSADILKKSKIYKKLKTSVTKFHKFKKSNGIQTNIKSIKQYIHQIIQFILSNQTQIQKVIKNINKYLGPSSLQMLSYLRIQQYSHYQSSSDNEEGLLIISLQTFQNFQKIYMKQHEAEFKQDKKLLAYSHYWHRALFQAFNQTLDYQRPYGNFGKPYDWQTQHHIQKKVIGIDNIEKCLHSALNRMLDYAIYLSGMMFQSQDCPFYNMQLNQQDKIQISQDRISRTLANQLIESQQTWINYNDQITEIMIQISYKIIDRLFLQTISELKKLNRKRSMKLNQ